MRRPQLVESWKSRRDRDGGIIARWRRKQSKKGRDPGELVVDAQTAAQAGFASLSRGERRQIIRSTIRESYRQRGEDGELTTDAQVHRALRRMGRGILTRREASRFYATAQRHRQQAAKAAGRTDA